MTPNQIQELNKLLTLSLEKKISQEQLGRLNDILNQNPESCDYCVEFYMLAACLQRPVRLSDVFLDKQEYKSQNEMFRELAIYENTAPAAEVEDATCTQGLIQKVVYERPSRKINKTLFFVALVSSAALLMMIAYVQLVPRRILTQVATVVDTVKTRFDGDRNIVSGSRLMNSTENLTLQSGVIKIAFDYGAEVVIEAPAQFRLESPEKMVLNSGRLFAKVPGSATGFIVDTPNSRVIDLGTEFGIEAGNDATNVYMFKGKASLIPGPKGRTGDSQILTMGLAKSVDSGSQVKNIPVKETFIRDISSRKGFIWRGQTAISLADMVAGGDGFGNTVSQIGIDPSCGEIRREKLWEYGHYVESSEYYPTFRIPPVDGVFVPRQSSLPVQIDSAGHTFNGFPETSKVFYMYITPDPYFLHLTENDVIIPHPLILKGINYAQSQKPCLVMHPNVGVTFDLNKIRGTIAGLEITAFEAVCGFSENCPEKTNNAEFYVLLDGKLAFYFNAVSVKERLADISVAIQNSNRFLTLAATDGRDGHGMDWCAFGAPTLKIKTRDQ